MIFHIGSNYIYQFWLWGLTFFFGLNSSDIGITYNVELEFLIPSLISMILILLGSSLILKSSINGFRKDEINSKNTFLGGIIIFTIPLLLMVIWHFVYTLGKGYPTFWGSFGGENYYLPSISFFLQLLVGGLTILSSLKRSKSKLTTLLT